MRKNFLLLFAACFLIVTLNSCDGTKNEPEKPTTTEQEFSEENVVLEGSCGERGDNVKYKVYANGYDLSIVVYGQGAMRSFGPSYNAPWKKLEDKDFKIVSARVEDGVTYLGSRSFSELNYLTKISLPSSLKMIEEYACSGCAIDTIVIPSGEISRSAFHGCKNLRCCILGNKVKSINFSAFGYCDKLDSIDFGPSVTNIGPSAFQWCTNLKECKIGDNVTDIESQAFDYCSGLEKIIIGAKVTNIGWAAFYACNNITNITCFAITPPKLNQSFFVNNDVLNVYVPAESVDEYKNNENWKNFNIHPISVSN